MSANGRAFRALYNVMLIEAHGYTQQRTDIAWSGRIEAASASAAVNEAVRRHYEGNMRDLVPSVVLLDAEVQS